MPPNDKFTCTLSETVLSTTEFQPLDTKFPTKAIHSGHKPAQWSNMEVVPPITLSTTYEQFGPGEPKSFEYSRGNNPTRQVLEKCLAALDGARYGIVAPSGLGALTMVTQLLSAGDHVLCIDDVYGGTNRYYNHVASKFGISATFYDFSDLQNLAAQVTNNTKMVWLECPTNPTLKVVDIVAIVRTVKLVNKDILVVVDNTFLTPYFQRPLTLGADIVMYSLTKYMNGHSDVIMGALVLNNDEIHTKLKFYQNTTGIVPSPFDCYLVDRSLKTLKLRMREHMYNGLQVAKFLESHCMVEKVLHPGLKSHPDHEIVKRQWSGCSGMVAFYIKGDVSDCRKFLKCLKYFITAESLGGFESLIEIPALMTHLSVPLNQREKLGITDNLIRLSVGLEAIEDLLEDLSQALNAIRTK